MVAITTESSRLSPSNTYCTIVAVGGTAEFEPRAWSTGTVNPDEGSVKGSDDCGSEKGCEDPAERNGGIREVNLDMVASCSLSSEASR